MFGKKFSSNIRRKKRMIISFVFTLALILSIGYAAITTNLGISGDLTVSKYIEEPIQIEFIETSTPESSDGYAIGEIFTFDIKVKNLKKTDLTDLNVVIDETGDEYPIEYLSTGQERVLSSSFQINDLDPELNVITAVVTGLINDEEFTVSKKLNVPVMGINNDLTIEVVADPPATGGDSYSLGDQVNLTITVTNTGNTVLDVVIRNPDGNDTIYLRPGAEDIFHYSADINETDVANGKASYTFSATGQRSGEVVVEKTKTIELNVNQ